MMGTVLTMNYRGRAMGEKISHKFSGRISCSKLKKAGLLGSKKVKVVA